MGYGRWEWWFGTGTGICWQSAGRASTTGSRRNSYPESGWWHCDLSCRSQRGTVGVSGKTRIAWCDATFNPWWGCMKVSPGCAHCYAETLAHRYGHDVWGPGGDRRFFGDRHWAEPMAWWRRAVRDGVRRRVFCGSMCDVFEDGPQLYGQRARLFELIEATPDLDWLLLTKRPENIERMTPDGLVLSPTISLGTSIAFKFSNDNRFPMLLRVA